MVVCKQLCNNTSGRLWTTVLFIILGVTTANPVQMYLRSRCLTPVNFCFKSYNQWTLYPDCHLKNTTHSIGSFQLWIFLRLQYSNWKWLQSFVSSFASKLLRNVPKEWPNFTISDECVSRIIFIVMIQLSLSFFLMNCISVI